LVGTYTECGASGFAPDFGIRPSAVHARATRVSRRRPPPARIPPGVEVRHSKACASRGGGECDCSQSYRAWVSVPRTRTKLQKTFKTLSAAVMWREDASVDLRRGAIGPPKAVTVRQAGEAWLVGAKAGSVRNRSGDPYKPSVLRGYEQALRAYVLPELGGIRLSDLRRAEVQAFVDRLIASGASASTVRNALMLLRVICRRAVVRGELHANPTQGLDLPAYRGRRERIASPTEATRLIEVLPWRDRAIWATAMYAGMRRGEVKR
jgi:hypothetical protein